MADDMSKGVRSTAAINGHPIHPMLVPFPIAFLVGTLATDLALGYPRPVLGTGVNVARRGRRGHGRLGGGFRAHRLSDHRTRPTWSDGLGPFSGQSSGGRAVARQPAVAHRQSEAAVLPTAIILSFIVVAILLVTGWMGGELAYRFKIGVIEEA